MILYPDFYFKNVQSIDLEELKKSNIKGIILDVDNTLIDYQKNMSEGIKDWVSRAKNESFKLCIVSNSSKLDKVSDVAKALELEYFFCARKPAKRRLSKGIRTIKTKTRGMCSNW